MSEFEHMVTKAREAANGNFGVLSVGEKIAAALILNRHDWLAGMGYTIAQAIDRVGTEWVRMIPAASKVLQEADLVIREAEKAARDEAAISPNRNEDIVDVSATLITSGQAPGYRDASFTFDVQRPGGARAHRICIRLRPEDGESIVRHLIDVHRLAWERGEPLDIQPGEKRPRWIDRLSSGV